MNYAKGIAALLVGAFAAAVLGIAAGMAIGVLILVAPFAWAWDVIARRARHTSTHPR